MRINIRLLSYSYLFLGAIIVHIFPLPDTYKSFIAQPGLVIVPYLFGILPYFILRKLLSLKDNENIVDIIISWSLGMILIMIIEILLYVNYLFSIRLLTILVLMFIVISFFIKQKMDLNIDKRIWAIVLYGFIFSIFITTYWNFPYANENDYITHSFYTTQIVENDRPLIFYSPYLPTLHTIYAILITIFNINPDNTLFLLWSSRFLLYPIYAVGIYLLVNSIFRNYNLSLIAAIIGSSLIYSSEGSLFPWHIAPKNMISIFLIYVLYVIFSFIDKSRHELNHSDIKKISFVSILFFITLYFTRDIGFIGYEIGWLLVIFSLLTILFYKLDHSKNFVFSITILFLTLIFIHKVNGFIAVIVSIIIIYINVSKISEKLLKYFIIGLSILISIIFIVFNFNIVPFPEEPILSLPAIKPYFLYGWNDIYNFFGEVYPNILSFLFMTGVIISLVTGKDKKILSTIVVALMIIILYILPIYSSYRFLTYFHPFLIISSIYAVDKFGKDISKISILLIMVVIISSVYLHDLGELNKSTIIKKQEIYKVFEIGEYIKNNIDKNSIIIYAGNVGWYQDISAEYGGVFPVNIWKNGEYRQDLLKDIYLANSSEDAYYKIKRLIDDKDNIVNFWDKDKKEIDRWYIRPDNIIILYDDYIANEYGDPNSIYKFFDQRYFALLYKTKNSNGENFYIFKMNDQITNFKNLFPNLTFNSNNWLATNKKWYGIEHNGIYKLTTDYDKIYWSSVMSNPIKVEQNRSYYLKISMKFKNAKSSHIKVVEYDINDDIWIRDIDYLVSDKEDWKEYSKMIQIPKNVNYTIIVLNAGYVNNTYYGNATTWFKDIEFIPYY